MSVLVASRRERQALEKEKETRGGVPYRKTALQSMSVGQSATENALKGQPTNATDEFDLDTLVLQFLSIAHTDGHLWHIKSPHFLKKLNGITNLACNRVTIIIHGTRTSLVLLPLQFDLLPQIFAL